MESTSLLSEFVGFWPNVWTSFWKLSDVEKVTNALALLAPVSVLWGFTTRRFLRSAKKDLNEQIEGLKTQNLALESANKRDKAEIAERDARLRELSFAVLSEARRLAESERSDGNEERAIAKLRDSFETVRPDLTRLCADLSLHHASIAPDFGSHHLAEAVRLADIALLLTPDDAEAADIRHELVEIDAEAAQTAGAYDPLDPKWDDARWFMHAGSTENAAAVFEALVAKGLAANEAGHYRRGERILRRAYRTGVELYGELDERALRATWPWLQDLDVLNLANQALELASSLSHRLEAGTILRAAADYYRARALHSLGRFFEALEITDMNVEAWTRLRGADDPETLANRYLRALLLGEIGETEKALPEAVVLLTVTERVEGKDRHDTLGTRHLRALLLQGAGEPKKALAEVEALLPIQERVNGPNHPSTLATRHLYASLLNDSGEPKKALAEVEALLPIQERVNGPEHPSALASRYLRASLHHDLGETAIALQEVGTLLLIRTRVSGLEHPDTLRTRWLNARIRARTDIQGAISELEAVTPLIAAKRSINHRHYKDAVDLLSKLRTGSGD
ncbi:tetratricopeptide repeat protein [Nitratireductor sp. CAU 1489]|uniref:Tetratricopeptide repeat protein n=1 Tax=Nitratireductor arenosus TaxID=2682096 RepID=A0A844QJ54_9HYPH|nr:tetratricopeptide repeat protein [Nitratireductor arenosus]